MTIPLPTIYAVTRAGIVSLTFSLLGCGSSVPPRLYLLSGGSGAAAIASQERGGGRAQQGEIALVSATPGVRLGVAVTIPQYLDRPEIMVRTNEYELEPMENARWAEGLTITASRAIADDLSMLLPRDDVVSLPTRTERAFDYRINVEFTKFDIGTDGRAEVAGRWVIVEVSADKERASARFRYAGDAGALDGKLAAAAMSDMLSKVSLEIQAALQQPSFANRR